MKIIRGKSGKSVVLSEFVRGYEGKPNSGNILIVDAVNTTALWNKLWLVNVRGFSSPENIEEVFKINAKDPKMFSLIAFEVNTTPENIPAFKRLEEKFDVPCALTVQDDCELYTYETD